MTDTAVAAKYPFMPEASEFAEDNKADLDSLLTSYLFEPARARGLGRVLDALSNSEVSYIPLNKEYDRLIEVMSYPYARILVSEVGDRFLTKRYALAEAVRMNKLLSSEGFETLRHVSDFLDIGADRDADGSLKMKFTDYLRLSNRLKSVDWKLINTEVRKGVVNLPQDKFSRLMQNALQDKIESELPLHVPEEYVATLKKDKTVIEGKLLELKASMSITKGEGMKMEFAPPCIRKIIEMAAAGINLPHSARFSLVSFLNALDLSYEQIIQIFAESPDFDESKSSYQIKHIIGETSGTKYTPPECHTMKTNGICFDPDSLCEQEWINHPLNYYRAKMRFAEKDKEKGTEKKDQ
ncbi:MAG: DNA primase large subunit PriL [Candidatus Methanomethylophilaceae archaeon]|nr:DNA primase large subunit PriL [Candidatus Methanomethylophilaceae archaeon]